MSSAAYSLKSALISVVASCEKSLFKVHYSAVSACMLEDHVFDSSAVDKGKIVGEALRCCNPKEHGKSKIGRNTRKSGLFPIVATIFKTLNWELATDKRFFRIVSDHGLSHSINAFRVIVHAFASAGLQMEVHFLIREIISYYKKVNLDVPDLFSTLLDLPADPHAGISSSIINALIKVFAENKMFENALDVFVQAKKFGLEPTILSCNFLLKCCIEANQVEFVRSLFEELKDFGPSPNVYTYTIMMDYYCKGHLGQNIDIKEASKVLEEMEKTGRSPTVVTYSVYIHGLCRAGCVDSASKLLEFLRTENKPLNCYCYNAVIHGFCQKGDLFEALRLFEDMKNNGISPDIYSYSILIDGFCKNGDVKYAIDLIEKMDDCDVKPSLVTYSSLFNSLCKSGQTDDSLDVFRKLGASGYKLDVISYNILMNGFLLQG
ncbi:hypothetical protein JCGZ_10931 [Jatropha curcas]|uniref:Pentacotripeptide-repeat region of PRORP domain-containing protein n=1 Tax=Jatropha curcas TaxID=180498 RepID=A0A067KUE8_JATCU|nr:hypothetical protein JCGZ_10931 [Jatropha curcas]